MVLLVWIRHLTILSMVLVNCNGCSILQQFSMCFEWRFRDVSTDTQNFLILGLNKKIILILEIIFLSYTEYYNFI
jgi:hypothetical protein